MVRRFVPLVLLGALLITGPAAGAHDGNDNFADAADIAVIPFSIETDNIEATIEAEEPLPCGEIGATIWYRWTATETAPVLADTAGSAIDTVLAVYAGAEDLGGLDLVDCNDDTIGLQSQVPFTAEAGQTYSLQVGGFGWEEGPIDLHLTHGAVISGTVTDETPEPLGDICVSSYTEYTPFPEEPEYVELAESGYTSTAEDGTYRLVIAPGTHKVRFTDCDSGAHVREWYDDAAGPDAAIPLVLADGVELTEIDAALTLGGTISGHVEDEAGEPVDVVCIEAVGPDGAPEIPWYGYYEEPSFAFPGADGDYTVRGLPAGDFRVRFGGCGFYFVPSPRPPSIASHELGLYEEEWYDDKPDFDSANLVEVLEGLPTTGIDAVLRLRPRPDVAVTALSVRNVPLSTDAGEVPGAGTAREITVSVDNIGDEAASTRLIVTACPRSHGRCRTIFDARRWIAAGTSMTRRIDWNALGMVGDVVIRARARTFDDSDRSNNVATVNHYVVVGGTGIGVNLCRSVRPPLPFLPSPSISTCPS